MLFINTRPIGKRPLDVRSINATSYALPLLAIRPCPLTDNDRHALDGLVAGKYQVLVVVSITACEYAFSALSKDNLTKLANLSQSGHLTIIAVGQPTAHALEQAGLKVSTPAIMSNEGMLAMPKIKRLQQGDKVLFWRGVGGRTLLSSTLQTQGIIVHAIAFYERCRPDDLSENATKLLEILPSHDTIVMLISSEMAFLHWQETADRLNIAWQNFHYLALGERLTALIAPFAKVCTLDTLDEPHVIWRLTHYDDTHRHQT